MMIVMLMVMIIMMMVIMVLMRMAMVMVEVHHYAMPAWRNGSASVSGAGGCGFDPHRGCFFVGRHPAKSPPAGFEPATCRLTA